MHGRCRVAVLSESKVNVYDAVTAKIVAAIEAARVAATEEQVERIAAIIKAAASMAAIGSDADTRAIATA